MSIRTELSTGSVRPFLETVFEEAESGTPHVITRHRKPGGNLRTQCVRIVKRAGLNPWPRIFQNLRSSRQTELSEQFAPHVVCKWIGNSPPVARKHYLQVTEDHFKRAIAGGAKCGAQVAQNEAQQVHAGSRIQLPFGPQRPPRVPVRGREKRVPVARCEEPRKVMAGVYGNRTHPELVFESRNGFEARGGHQTSKHSREVS